MKKIVLFIVISIGLFSCSSDDEIIIVNDNLVGTWNWTSTDGGISGQIHETPATTGKSIELNLMENYDYTIVENDVEISSGTYDLSLEESILSGEMEIFITYSHNYQNQDVVVSGIINVQGAINLSITEDIADGVVSVFEKIE